MIVVDSSAWVELFRATESEVCRKVEQLLSARARLAVTEVVVMEVLAGASTPAARQQLRARILAFPILRLRGLSGYEAAAELYSACRAAGETIRKLTDCLVAVPTIEAGATLLQADRDFETLARHTRLRLEPLSS